MKGDHWCARKTAFAPGIEKFTIAGTALVGLVLGLLAEGISPAFGSFELAIDSSSFLRESSVRPESSSYLRLGSDLETQGQWLEAKSYLQALIFLPEPGSLTAEATDLYVATSRKLLSKHQFTLGRKLHSWSRADDEWMAGIWSPRFMWDPLRPTQVGLTGAFYEYQSRRWRLTAFATPVSVPERGAVLKAENGKIESFSPYYNPLPEQLVFNQSTVDIRYGLNQPSLSRSLFRPGGAIALRYGEDQGGWANIAYGLLPVNQVDLAAEVAMDLTNGYGYFDAQIHPRFRVHHLLTAETGYNGSTWSLWGSITSERPLQLETSTRWLYERVGPSLISAAGGSVLLSKGLSVSMSYLSVRETVEGEPSETDVKIDLPSRFAFRRALQFSGDWKANKKTNWRLNATHDIEYSATLIASDIVYQMQPQMTVGLGVDWISASTRKGWLGQYRGNERVRGAISYVF